MKKTFCLFFVILFGFLNKAAYSATCMEPSKLFTYTTWTEECYKGPPCLPGDDIVRSTTMLQSNTGWHLVSAPVNDVFQGKNAVFSNAIYSKEKGLTCQYKTDQNEIITTQPDTPIYKKEDLADSWQQHWECVSPSRNISDCPIN